jgi:hypothetical protein
MIGDDYRITPNVLEGIFLLDEVKNYERDVLSKLQKIK